MLLIFWREAVAEVPPEEEEEPNRGRVRRRRELPFQRISISAKWLLEFNLTGVAYPIQHHKLSTTAHAFIYISTDANAALRSRIMTSAAHEALFAGLGTATLGAHHSLSGLKARWKPSGLLPRYLALEKAKLRRPK